ncbi:MAG: peptide chain release factor N(5)-glutamine methyltransferase [bacterium]|nr:peptide chain release factor N(5)-glutamine methyltransferase [bacterium]
MLVKEALYRARKELQQIGIESFWLDGDLLLAHLLSIDRTALYINLNERLSSAIQSQFFELIKRRMAKEPVAYLVGEKEFMGLSFKVTTDVLIPRPETEILVETGISLASNMDRPIIIDVGTGSGAIAISLAKYLKNQPQLFAIDISYPALRQAKLNASRLKAKVFFLCSDMLSGLRSKADLIISNPPYVERDSLPPHEPQIALDGGIDGLSFYPRIFSLVHLLLKKQGFLAIEMGAGQSKAISEIAKRQGFSQINTREDLAGIERVLVAIND